MRVQCFPLEFFKEDRAGNVRDFAPELGQVEDAPSHDQVDGQTGFNAIGCPQLPFFNLASALEGSMIDLNAPAQAVPVDLFDGAGGAGDFAGRQQHPSQGLHSGRGVDFLSQDCPQVQRRQVGFALGRLQPDWRKTKLQMGDPRSDHFGKMRHETLPPDHLFGRRLETLTLAVLSQLRACNNWHSIAREWVYGDAPVTDLGKAEAEFYARG